MNRSVLIIALLGCIATGCVTSYTTVKDEPRVSVHFASAQAAQTFYEAYIKDNYAPSPEDRGPGLSVEAGFERRKLKTDNVLFNEAVREAGTNQDGIISEAEAQAYSAKVSLRNP
jgi:hypothetical protein